MSVKFVQKRDFRLLQRLCLILGLSVLSSACGLSVFGSAGDDIRYGIQEGPGGSSLMALAERLEADSQYSASVTLYRQMIGYKPLDYRPRLGLGRSLMSLGAYDEALSVLLDARALAMDAPDLMTALGTVYLLFGEAEIALEYLTLAVKTGAAPASAYSGSGMALDLVGQHPEALDVLNQGLLSYPGDLGLLNNLALSKALAGDTAQAVPAFIALARRPDADQQVRQNLALALALDGDLDRAWRILTMDLDTRGADRVLGSFLTLASLKQAQRLRSLIYRASSPRHDLEQAANRSDQGLLPGAEDLIERVLEEKRPQIRQAVAQVTRADKMPEVPPLMDPEGWAVQIAAYRNLEDLALGWTLLRDRYLDILGPLEPRRSELDFGDRDREPAGLYYRLNAGPLAGLHEAQMICARMKDRGQDCWIRPPEPSEGRIPARTTE